MRVKWNQQAERQLRQTFLYIRDAFGRKAGEDFKREVRREPQAQADGRAER